MKCISLHQPWGSAIAGGIKRIETRGWSTKVRGRIAIHAAKRWTGDQQLLARMYAEHLPADIPRGVVVATGVLRDVVSTDSLNARGIPDLERIFGDYTPGRFGWLLDDVVLLEHPIAWPGKQGFFDVPDHLFPARALAPPAVGPQPDFFQQEQR